MKSALLLIEGQNEWLSPQGKLQRLIEDREMFDQSAKNIEKALQHARSIDMPVAHVGLRFQAGYPELANGKSGLRKAIPVLAPFHCMSLVPDFMNRCNLHRVSSWLPAVQVPAVSQAQIWISGYGTTILRKCFWQVSPPTYV